MCIAAGTLAAGCMGDDTTSASALVARDEARASSVRITGASSSQRRLLRSILAGMGNTRITEIDIRATTRPRLPDGQAMSLHAKHDDDLRAGWEQMLVAGVFSERSGLLALPPIATAGSRQIRGSMTIGATKPDPRFKPFRRDDAGAVLDGIERAARRSGAKLERVELLQPEGLAVAARLRVEQPARYLSERLDVLFEELDSDTARYEGRYLEVVDGRGRPVLKEFGVSRLHWGGGGPVDKRYAGCAFLGLSRPSGYDPPPCPVEQ